MKRDTVNWTDLNKMSARLTVGDAIPRTWKGDALAVLNLHPAAVDGEDKLWIIDHYKMLTDAQFMAFAFWCAEQALALLEKPDAEVIGAMAGYKADPSSIKLRNHLNDAARDQIIHRAWNDYLHDAVYKTVRAVTEEYPGLTMAPCSNWMSLARMNKVQPTSQTHSPEAYKAEMKAYDDQVDFLRTLLTETNK